MSLAEPKTEQEWREAILRTWNVYGTGEPLSRSMVDHLAIQFAKPLECPKVPLAVLDEYPYAHVWQITTAFYHEHLVAGRLR